MSHCKDLNVTENWRRGWCGGEVTSRGQLEDLSFHPALKPTSLLLPYRSPPPANNTNEGPSVFLRKPLQTLEGSSPTFPKSSLWTHFDTWWKTKKKNQREHTIWHWHLSVTQVWADWPLTFKYSLTWTSIPIYWSMSFPTVFRDSQMGRGAEDSLFSRLPWLRTYVFSEYSVILGDCLTWMFFFSSVLSTNSNKKHRPLSCIFPKPVTQGLCVCIKI